MPEAQCGHCGPALSGVLSSTAGGGAPEEAPEQQGKAKGREWPPGGSRGPGSQGELSSDP